MSEKPEMHQCCAEIKPPTGDHPGQISYGYFIVVDGLLTMTDAKGEVAQDDSGKAYTHRLERGDDPHVVACRLTKKLRDALRGTTKDGAPPAGFNRPLSYPKSGIY
jgi:hypothetical protein